MEAWFRRMWTVAVRHVSSVCLRLAVLSGNAGGCLEQHDGEAVLGLLAAGCIVVRCSLLSRGKNERCCTYLMGLFILFFQFQLCFSLSSILSKMQ